MTLRASNIAHLVTRLRPIFVALAAVTVFAEKKAADADPSARFKSLSYGFANDNYWLLFPFHAYWDTSANITDQGMKKLFRNHLNLVAGTEIDLPAVKSNRTVLGRSSGQ